MCDILFHKLFNSYLCQHFLPTMQLLDMCPRSKFSQHFYMGLWLSKSVRIDTLPAKSSSLILTSNISKNWCKFHFWLTFEVTLSWPTFPQLLSYSIRTNFCLSFIPPLSFTIDRHSCHKHFNGIGRKIKYINIQRLAEYLTVHESSLVGGGFGRGKRIPHPLQEGTQISPFLGEECIHFVNY